MIERREEGTGKDGWGVEVIAGDRTGEEERMQERRGQEKVGGQGVGGDRRAKKMHGIKRDGTEGTWEGESTRGGRQEWKRKGISVLTEKGGGGYLLVSGSQHTVTRQLSKPNPHNICI